MWTKTIKTGLLSVAVMAILSGCGGDDETNALLPAEYEVVVTNLTNFQPLSPVGISLDADGSFFSIGERASSALEHLAEDGDNTGILADMQISTSTSGVLLPGQSAVLTLKKGFGVKKFSSFSMLVNTNDAFTGVNGHNIGSLKVGEKMMFNTKAYDAGTEANSESAGTIPGPADGGEGFNENRDDVNVVQAHRGVVSKDDGLATSVLTEQHKFDNPVMRVIVKRIK